MREPGCSPACFLASSLVNGPDAAVNTQEFQVVEQLFAAASALPARERPAFLAASETSSELKSEVERLLEADERAGAFLERSVELEAARVTTERQGGSGQAWKGRAIGPYRVVSELGSGGMSSVMLAVRVGDEFEQQVAIKVLRWGSASEEILDRFKTERRILASLDHPHIAKLYDGGTTDDGLPYFVMEVITGEPIDQYCRVGRLELPARIQLFLQVCSAVEFAHRNLVVHRDIKPSNVLVTPEGLPKLLDFGIAKVLDPTLARGGKETELGWRWLTPRYASPEQIRGEPVTTATDVYSLGVVLFELLTGTAPHGEALNPAELERAVLTQEPPLLSTAVARLGERAAGRLGLLGSASDWGPRLRGDLDNIVAKALAKLPSERYGSVEQLSADLRLYLAGHPISARPATLGYRAAKFLRRHRLGAAIAAGAVLALIAFAATVTGLLSRTREERDRSLQVTGLLEDLFEIADEDAASGDSITARQLLDRGAQKVTSQLSGDDEIRPRLLSTLADLYYKLEVFDEAAALYRQELEIYRQSGGKPSAELAKCLNNLGKAYANAAHYDLALPFFREAMEVRRVVFGEDHHEFAGVVSNLGLLLHDLGRYAEAEPLYEQAAAIDLRQSPGLDAVSFAVTNLALLRFDQGRYDEAEALYRQGVAERIRKHGEGSEAEALILPYLAQTLRAQGRAVEAEQIARRAVSAWQGVRSPDRTELGRALAVLGGILVDEGQLAEAEATLRKSLSERQAVLPPRHPEVAESLLELGALRAAQGRFDEAEAEWSLALEIYRENLPAGHPLTGLPLALLGSLVADQGNCGRARPLLEEAQKVLPSAVNAAQAGMKALAKCGASPPSPS